MYTRMMQIPAGTGHPSSSDGKLNLCHKVSSRSPSVLDAFRKCHLFQKSKNSAAEVPRAKETGFVTGTLLQSV